MESVGPTGTATRGFLYTSGAFSTIDILGSARGAPDRSDYHYSPGAGATLATGINNSGEIVGYYAGSSSYTNGFLGGGVNPKYMVMGVTYAPPEPSSGMILHPNQAIQTGSSLGSGIGLGVNTSNNRTDWLSNDGTMLNMQYQGGVLLPQFAFGGGSEYRISNFSLIDFPSASATFAAEVNKSLSTEDPLSAYKPAVPLAAYERAAGGSSSWYPEFDVYQDNLYGTFMFAPADYYYTTASTPPVVSALSPNSSTAGGTDISFTNSGFLTGSTVHWNEPVVPISYTYGINDSGQIVGIYRPVNHDYDVIWLWLNAVGALSDPTSSRSSVVWNGYGYNGYDLIRAPATVHVLNNGGATLLYAPDFDLFAIQLGGERKKLTVDINEFSQEKMPLSIGVLTDASGSMRDTISDGDSLHPHNLTKRSLAESAARRILSNALSAGMKFIPPKNPRDILDKGIYIQEVLTVKRRRVLFVISDGRENESKLKFDKVVKYLSKSGAVFYGISYGKDAVEVSASVLPELAQATGGQALVVKLTHSASSSQDDVNEFTSTVVAAPYSRGHHRGLSWTRASTRNTSGSDDEDISRKPLRMRVLNGGGARLSITSTVTSEQSIEVPAGPPLQKPDFSSPLRVRVLNSGDARLIIKTEVIDGAASRGNRKEFSGPEKDGRLGEHEITHSSSLPENTQPGRWVYQVGEDPDHFRAFVRMQRVQLGFPILPRSRTHRIARGGRKT